MGFALLAFSTFLVFLLKLWWFSDFKKKIDRIPGPPRLPLVGNTVELVKNVHNLIELTHTRWSSEYGPIFKTQNFQFFMVHLSSPEYIEEVLKSTTLLTKGFNYRFLQDWLGDGLLTSTGAKWRTQRRLLTPAFHFQILESFMDVFNEQSCVLVEQFERRLKDENEVDIYPVLTRCTLDIICETAMGVPVNAQTEETEYTKAVFRVAHIIQERTLTPWLFPNFMFHRSQLGKEYSQCLQVIHSFTKQVIRERKMKLQLMQEEDCGFENSEKKKKAFLDLLLDASNDGQALSDDNIQEEVDTFMFAGHDTNSAALTWFLYLMAKHPEEQEKLYQELTEVFEGSQRPCTSKDIPHLKHLECCIKETLRLLPSAPQITRRINQEIHLGEYTIPEGCSVNILIRAVHRNPDYFPDPDLYKPERFLPENSKGRHPYAYIPFSAGPRNCIGQKFALLEQKVILANVLRKFRFELSPKTEFDPRLQIILKPKDQLILRVLPRC